MDAMFAIQLERQKGRSLGVHCGLSQVQGNYVACNKLAITLSEGRIKRALDVAHVWLENSLF